MARGWIDPRSTRSLSPASAHSCSCDILHPSLGFRSLANTPPPPLHPRRRGIYFTWLVAGRATIAPPVVHPLHYKHPNLVLPPLKSSHQSRWRCGIKANLLWTLVLRIVGIFEDDVRGKLCHSSSRLKNRGDFSSAKKLLIIWSIGEQCWVWKKSLLATMSFTNINHYHKTK